jgi:hypothetical protein
MNRFRPDSLLALISQNARWGVAIRLGRRVADFLRVGALTGLLGAAGCTKCILRQQGRCQDVLRYESNGLGITPYLSSTVVFSNVWCASIFFEHMMGRSS